LPGLLFLTAAVVFDQGFFDSACNVRTVIVAVFPQAMVGAHAENIGIDRRRRAFDKRGAGDFQSSDLSNVQSLSTNAPMSLEIRKSSTGLGLFATRPFKKGEFIIEYFGAAMSGAEADKSRNRYVFSLTNKKAIDGRTRANIARYINHSCKPNARARGTKRIWINAERRINPGDEITIDYGKEYIELFIDDCKCAKCK
jgi:hypothetical protein